MMMSLLFKNDHGKPHDFQEAALGFQVKLVSINECLINTSG